MRSEDVDAPGDVYPVVVLDDIPDSRDEVGWSSNVDPDPLRSRVAPISVSDSR